MKSRETQPKGQTPQNNHHKGIDERDKWRHIDAECIRTGNEYGVSKVHEYWAEQGYSQHEINHEHSAAEHLAREKDFIERRDQQRSQTMQQRMDIDD